MFSTQVIFHTSKFYRMCHYPPALYVLTGWLTAAPFSASRALTAAAAVVDHIAREYCAQENDGIILQSQILDDDFHLSGWGW